MSISNCADESDRTTANNSMFKQRLGRVYAHILNHNTVIWSDKAGKQPATPGRAAGINTALAKQITTLNAGERDGASGYVKRTWCEWRRKPCKRRPYKAAFCLKRYQRWKVKTSQVAGPLFLLSVYLLYLSVIGNQLSKPWLARLTDQWQFFTWFIW